MKAEAKKLTTLDEIKEELKLGNTIHCAFIQSGTIGTILGLKDVKTNPLVKIRIWGETCWFDYDKVISKASISSYSSSPFNI